MLNELSPEWYFGRRMAKQGDAKENFNKLLAANRKAALRNNVVLLEACTYGKNIASH